MFKRLPIQNIVSWTALISGYTDNGWGEDALIWHTCMYSEGNIQYGQDEEALNHFGSLQRERILPNMVTFLHLKSCPTIDKE